MKRNGLDMRLRTREGLPVRLLFTRYTSKCLDRWRPLGEAPKTPKN